uniref:Uncharacterized protein n=1 Tax=Triticum urartu TaxID=4572 RepID=A0A8R7P8I8_TRIUA
MVVRALPPPSLHHLRHTQPPPSAPLFFAHGNRGRSCQVRSHHPPQPSLQPRKNREESDACVLLLFWLSKLSLELIQQPDISWTLNNIILMTGNNIIQLASFFVEEE